MYFHIIKYIIFYNTFYNILSHYSLYYNTKLRGDIKMKSFRLKKEYTDYENKSLRLPKDLIEKVQQLANDNEMSFNKVVMQCIEFALENIEDSNNN